MWMVTFRDITLYLQKLKIIYETVNQPKKEIKSIEEAIRIVESFGEKELDSIKSKLPVQMDGSTNKGKKRGNSFSKNAELLFQKQSRDLMGTKLDYESLYNDDQVMKYIKSTPKTKVLKDATAMDLKLIYCLLTGEKRETKGNKNEVYDAIKGNIRARERGEAFSKMI